MEIKKIEPCGFCFGVKNALKKTLELRENTTKNINIYSLGKLFHNDFEIKKLAEKGIITIDDNRRTRFDLLDEIKDGIVVFTAHGVCDQVYEKTKEKKLEYLDCTCPKVLKIHATIKEYLLHNYKVFYIGKKNHPETEGVLGINKNIVLLEKEEDLNKVFLNKKDLIFATNQTTLSFDLCEGIYNKIKEKYPNTIIDNSICTSTFERQSALKNHLDCDLILIIGDQKSSNTKSLFEYSKKLHLNSIFISSLTDLFFLIKSENILFNIKKIGVISGASTPDYLIDEVIQYLGSIK